MSPRISKHPSSPELPTPKSQRCISVFLCQCFSRAYLFRCTLVGSSICLGNRLTDLNLLSFSMLQQGISLCRLDVLQCLYHIKNGPDHGRNTTLPTGISHLSFGEERTIQNPFSGNTVPSLHNPRTYLPGFLIIKNWGGGSNKAMPKQVTFSFFFWNRKQVMI